MEKLGQLRAQEDWDLIVVDTPPSRSALDFLDAPKRLGSFLDGRFIRMLMAPAKAGGRAGMRFVNLGMAGLSMFTGALNKLLGAGLLRDVQTFVAAMDTMFGGFRTRADATYRLLQAPGTAFLVVAAPERDALREAAYFVERLDADRMPLAGLVLNRVHGAEAAGLSAERALAAAENLEAQAPAEEDPEEEDLEKHPKDQALEAADPESENLGPDGIVDRGSGQGQGRSAPSPGRDPESINPRTEPMAPTAPTAQHPGDADRLAAGLLRLHAEHMRQRGREQRTRDRFAALHPEVPVAEVAALSSDVHDIAGLREIGRLLAEGQELPATDGGSPTGGPAG